MGKKHKDSFKKLKFSLTNEPVLAFTNSKEPFQLFTDASKDTIGAFLEQDG